METGSQNDKMKVETFTSEPPLKKQKTEHVAGDPTLPRVPAPRKTPETIDLRTLLSGPVTSKEQQRSLDALAKVFRKKKKIVVVAGAGISVGAGSMYTQYEAPPLIPPNRSRNPACTPMVMRLVWLTPFKTQSRIFGVQVVYFLHYGRITN